VMLGLEVPVRFGENSKKVQTAVVADMDWKVEGSRQLIDADSREGQVVFLVEIAETAEIAGGGAGEFVWEEIVEW
jgi:hypothetical protein